MATTPVQPGTAPANAPSRRNVLALMAAAPALALPAAASARTGSRLEALIAEWRAAEHALDAYIETVQQPAEDAFARSRKAIPHFTSTPYKSIGGERGFSTERPESIALAWTMVRWDRDRPSVRETMGDAIRTARQTAAADIKRMRAEARLRRQYQIDEIEQRAGELGSAASEALRKVFEHPVSNIAELSRKMAIIEEQDGFAMEYACQAIVADVQRLAGEA